MGILLDTSVLIAMERDPARMTVLLERLREETPGISAMTVSELLHGVHRADSAQRRARREGFIQEVLSTLLVYPFDLVVARVHARIWADLKRSGNMIGAYDLLIAATAIAHDLPLVTENRRHFERVEGLILADL